MPSQVRILPPPLLIPYRRQRGEIPARVTRLSKNLQVTIPMSQFAAAGLREGDRFRVMASGPGRIELTRADELVGQPPLEPHTR
jgi:hypothetical protein